MQLTFTVIGSFRPNQSEEEQNYPFLGTLEGFRTAARELGKYIGSIDNNRLLIAWSNDYLPKQVCGGEYYFEETADYHAMLGFLDALKWNAHGRLQIQTSEKTREIMQIAHEINNLKTSNKKIYDEIVFQIKELSFANDSIKNRDLVKKIDSLNKEPFSELHYLGYLLERHHEFSRLYLKYKPPIISATNITNKMLRSRICKNLLVPAVDVVITIGGGKATEDGADLTIALEKLLLAFPEFGGMSQKYILSSVDIAKNGLKKVKYSEIRSQINHNTKICSNEIRCLIKNLNSSCDRNTMKSVNIGIITIKEEEYNSVFCRLNEPQILEGKEIRYRFAKLENGNTVALTRCTEQGNLEAQAIAKCMLDDLHPQWILVVGIAGGLPSSDFSLGDVIISSYIYDLTLEEVAQDGRTYDIRGGWLHDNANRVVQDLPGLLNTDLSSWNDSVIPRPSFDLSKIQDSINGDEEWKDKVARSLHSNFSIDRKPHAITGKIAASDRLIKDYLIPSQWKEVARKIIAVEMESAGVYRAARKYPMLTIRGISDIVGLKREEVWTQYACDTAAAFAISLAGSDALLMSSDLTVE